MAGLSAVIFLPDDTSKTGYGRPMLLQNLMGTPMLSWLVDSMSAGGVERFFLVCRPQNAAEAKRCFPADVELVCADEDQAADQLHVFLSTASDAEEDVIVVTGPCILLPYAAEDCAFDGPPEPAPMFCVPREAFMDALDQRQDILDFLKAQGVPYTDRDGVYGVQDLAELTEWQPVVNRCRLYRLAQSGVEVWDYGSTYVDPAVSVAPGAALLPGAILRGRTVIGEGCTIGPNAYLEDSRIGPGTVVNSSQVFQAVIGSGTHVGPYAYVRPGTVVGSHAKIGDFVEVKNAKTGDGARISHLSYVADAEVGKNVRFGCGSATVNFDREKKYKTIVEDDAFVGSGVSLIAPLTVGQGAYVAAGSAVTDDIPAMALAIARARTTVKKDWAAKHKLKK